eukprot:COSAG02_NODE_22_length_53020_cov_16.223125_47_plen_102_part_00
MATERRGVARDTWRSKEEARAELTRLHNAWLTCGSTARKSEDDRKKDEKSKYTYASSAREQRKGSLAKFRWHRSVKKQKRIAIVRSFAKEFVMCERKTMHN